jgi:SAM-dependent methyltransferase
MTAQRLNSTFRAVTDRAYKSGAADVRKRRFANALIQFVALNRRKETQDKSHRNMFANAKSYERFMGRWSRLIADRLLDFTSLPDEGDVLDIGSGTGALSFLIATNKANTRVVGIDPSKEYVEYANSVNSVPERIHFEIGDAQNVRFPSAKFRSCLSLLVFNFIPDPLKAVQEARRVTRPGGLIAAAVWDYGGNMKMLRAFWDAAASIDDRAGKLNEAHMPLSRAGELGNLWKTGGLENIDEQPLDIEMQFPSFDDFWNPFLLGQGPAGAYAARLDPAASQLLRDELMRRLSVDEENIPFVLPARAWAVRGTVPFG